MKPSDDHPWRKPIVSEAQRARREAWRRRKAAERARCAATLLADPGPGQAAESRRRAKPIRRLSPAIRRRITYQWAARRLAELAGDVRRLETVVEWLQRRVGVAPDDTDDQS